MCLQTRDEAALGRRFRKPLAMFAVMRRCRRIYPCFLAAIPGAIVFLAANLSPASADAFVVQGSTTFTARLMVPHQAAIEAKTGHKLSIIPNKSINGLIAVLEGRADLAMISAPLERELDVIRPERPDLPYKRLNVFEVSRVRVAFAVHPSNLVRSVSLDSIRKVLRGEINNWKELGGADLPIRPVMVREGGGVTVTVQAQLLDGIPAAPEVIRVQTPNQVLKIVEQEPGALGVSQFVLVRQRSIPELVTDRTVEQHLSFVSLGTPTPAIQAVIDATRSVAAENLN